MAYLTFHNVTYPDLTFKRHLLLLTRDFFNLDKKRNLIILNNTQLSGKIAAKSFA